MGYPSLGLSLARGFHVDSAECRRKVENIVGGSRGGGNGPDKKPREAEAGRTRRGVTEAREATDTYIHV